jgi:hypothetical protein
MTRTSLVTDPFGHDPAKPGGDYESEMDVFKLLITSDLPRDAKFGRAPYCRLFPGPVLTMRKMMRKIKFTSRPADRFQACFRATNGCNFSRFFTQFVALLNQPISQDVLQDRLLFLG